MLKDLEIKLLEVLFNNRGGKPVTSRTIQRELIEYVDDKEIIYHLKNLKEKKLIRTVRVPGNNKGALKFSAYDKYELNSFGEELVENDYIMPEKQNNQPQTLIIGEYINLGSVTNIEINTFEIINELPITEDLKNEIKEIVIEIEKETSKEKINKNHIKQQFKKIADKGFSKLTDAALSYIIKQIIG